MSRIIVTCECGKKIEMKPHEFPLHCRCGKTHLYNPNTPIPTIFNDGEIKKYNSDSTHKVTACITTFMRQYAVDNLVISIQKYYPDMQILIIDTRGNLSWGRNRLVEQCATEYCLILDDDLEFVDNTKIEFLVQILEQDLELMCIGNVWHEDKQMRSFGSDMKMFRGTMEYWYPPTCNWKYINNIRYRYCDIVPNSFLARTEVLKQNPWDEELALIEHAAWFWTLKQKAEWRIAITDSVAMKHSKDRQNVEYSAIRNNISTYNAINKTKYGINKKMFVSNNISSDIELDTLITMPNIIVFGAGHQGTRLYVQLLHILGWDLGVYNDIFWENKCLKQINSMMLCEMGVGDCRKDINGEFANIVNRCISHGGYDENPDIIVDKFILTLKEPWMLKDPRMVLTLRDYRWQKFIHEKQPVLILVERNIERAKQTYDKSRSDLYNNIFGVGFEWIRNKAREEFIAYPYNKIFVPYERLIECFSKIDFNIVT